MTETTSRSQIVHRWHTRPVFFVTDVNRAARFYVEKLGFEKGWHEAEGAGKICQVNHGECDIILCEDATRRDRGPSRETSRSDDGPTKYSPAHLFNKRSQ